MDAKIDVWIKNLRPETGKVYGRYLRRVLEGEDPTAIVSAVKEESRTNSFDTYTRILTKANEYTQKGRHITTYAFRRFLFDHGIQILPPFV